MKNSDSRVHLYIYQQGSLSNLLVSSVALKDSMELLATIPPVYPEWLGGRHFTQAHATRFAYVGGEMARGIATVEMVEALAHCGCLGFFGSAGLSLDTVSDVIDRLNQTLTAKQLPWGINLIHSPENPKLETDLVELYLAKKVQRVSASAFMKLEPSIVHYAAKGLTRNPDGTIQRQQFLFAKVSRPEVASAFLKPAPEAILLRLVAEGKISAEEAAIAREIPLATELTVEADSGGHTDNRPLTVLFPTIMRLRESLCPSSQSGVPQVRLGAAGGLGTPEAVAAAFSMGADYVLIGTVHQSCIESGLHESARVMLCQAGLADVAMTAAGDMFEQGVKVQVLKRGTLMAARGNRLYEIYKHYESIEALPDSVRHELENKIFRQPLDQVWERCEAYLKKNNRAEELEKSQTDGRVRLARLCKWYLGQSSLWPLHGQTERMADYQIWCGPAMGAFNEWVRGSFLETPEARTITQVALNLMEGAAQVTRAQQMRALNLPLHPQDYIPKPHKLSL